MSALEWLRKANQRLGKGGVTLELSGKNNNLYLRGMFPGKLLEDPTPKQRRIALKMRALTRQDVAIAENIARQVLLDLNRGEFDWRKFGEGFDDPSLPTTIGDWAKQLEEDKRCKISDYTWKYAYASLIATLPLELEPTEEILMAWILERDPNASTMRRKYLSIAKSICEMAGIAHKKIDRLTRENPSKPINPRSLPEDSEIEETWRSITDPQWQQTYGMLATYGLRPHELFRLDLSDFPDVKILLNTKTGERLVPPLYPGWVDKFGLSDRFELPSNLEWEEATPNHKLGRKIGSGFTRHKFGDPYNLRHCYARRCLQLGLTSDVSAALMGHSRRIHENRYRAFIRGSVYVDIAKKVIQRAIDS